MWSFFNPSRKRCKKSGYATQRTAIFIKEKRIAHPLQNICFRLILHVCAIGLHLEDHVFGMTTLSNINFREFDLRKKNTSSYLCMWAVLRTTLLHSLRVTFLSQSIPEAHIKKTNLSTNKKRFVLKASQYCNLQARKGRDRKCLHPFQVQQPATVNGRNSMLKVVSAQLLFHPPHSSASIPGLLQLLEVLPSRELFR